MNLKIQNLIYEMKERGLDMFTSEILQAEAKIIEDASLALYNAIPGLDIMIKNKKLGSYQDVTKGINVDGSCKQYNLSIVLGQSNQPMVRVVFAKEGYEVTEEKYFRKDEYHNFLVLIHVPQSQNEVLGLASDWLRSKLETRLEESNDGNE